MATWAAVVCATLAVAGPDPAETVLRIDAAAVLHRVSPYLYGACIEDVNHEIYGGLYSQLIFGESFQESPPPAPLNGFTAHGGEWTARGGTLAAAAGDGPKLVSTDRPVGDGEVGVEIRFPSAQGGNAGLILRVDSAGKGADAFVGYEVSLETAGFLVLGRHRKNWEPIRRVPCAVPVDRWIPLTVRMKGAVLGVEVDGRPVLSFEDVEHPLGPGGIGLRTWQRPARYRNLWVKTPDGRRDLPFEHPDVRAPRYGVSGMWSPFRKGSAKGRYAVEMRDPFVGRQCQRLTFESGAGEVGIENRGLNRWGLNVVAARPFEGYLWARAETPAEVALGLESRDGSKTLARTVVNVKGDAWTKYPFALTPVGADEAGRFALSLGRPGSVVVGHVFLQPGDWGRFKGLPVRKDVAEALVDQGVTVLRYGGSMVNHPAYRWKTMIGPRDRRPPTAGTWYDHSSNGWGVFDFLNFCEAAGFLAIPALNSGETAQDMVDFVEYANGPADSPWGRKRAADGHPEPYRLTHVEIGNEEAVDDAYWQKFRPIAEAVWAKDPGLILVVGDFAYGRVIEDPFDFRGGVAVKSLAAHKTILELARSRGREVWFDIHISTDHPPEPNGLRPERSYIEQLGKLAPGAKFKVAIFEYNSGNHAMKRALSNALATNEVERVGDLLPVACSANGLQPDGQNDNGWDQGLLFLNPSKVWLQPPGHVLRMSRRNYQPLLIRAEARGDVETFSANAKRSEDGKTLVLQVVNWGDAPRPTRIEVDGFRPSMATATVEELSGPLDAANTAEEPARVAPRSNSWAHGMTRGRASYAFPPRSFTVIRFD